MFSRGRDETAARKGELKKEEKRNTKELGAYEKKKGEKRGEEKRKQAKEEKEKKKREREKERKKSELANKLTCLAS